MKELRTISSYLEPENRNVLWLNLNNNQTYRFHLGEWKPIDNLGEGGGNGTPGKDGVSPTVSINKVGTKTEITITDVFGKHTAVINDGINSSADNLLPDMRVFNKILCIGDSWTYGVIDYYENGEIRGRGVKQYSYPAYLSSYIGKPCTNKGDAGKTTIEWLDNHGSEDFSGHDACIMFLGINDITRFSSQAQIKTAITGIINKVKQDNAHIKIFSLSLPSFYTNSTTGRNVNNAIKEAVIAESDCYYIDMTDITNDDILRDYHPTALGYTQFAKIIFKRISDYINANIEEFNGIYLDEVPDIPGNYPIMHNELELAAGNNLFDYTTAIKGQRIDTTGNQFNDNGGIVSDWILIPEGTKTLYFKNMPTDGQSGIRFGCLYDANKQKITALDMLAGTANFSKSVATGAKYLRFDLYMGESVLPTTDYSNVMVSITDIPYEPYAAKVSKIAGYDI